MAQELFKTDLTARDYANGKKMFSAGKCIACHRIEGTGGFSGPDLGSVAKRYSIKGLGQIIISNFRQCAKPADGHQDHT
jgi:cytochrome c2